ncbi:MAG: hypothetical protein DRI61_00350 [Chloroflexi bacterium]|nr:MAG: hypothetical protein DRI61_00350 [Chloroflexota bacterium]
MPSLNKCMKSIRDLVSEKGHEDSLEDIPLKLLFAIVEVSEAVDIWKKNNFKEIEDIEEEIIDAVFYLLDAYGILLRDIGGKDPDQMFEYKLKKNFKRPRRYGRHDSE